TAEHEFYQADVIGFEVVNAKGEVLGRVKEFFSAGAHDVMRVEHKGGERLLPVAGDVIRRIDLAAGKVEVEWGADWGSASIAGRGSGKGSPGSGSTASRDGRGKAGCGAWRYGTRATSRPTTTARSTTGRTGAVPAW